ncbi:MAG TPA: STAS domain-containing protein [Solirubrobacteraceae bacterium]|nr:STAS domain-containing protein [Solirubrobacteraceae bacterium]
MADDTARRAEPNGLQIDVVRGVENDTIALRGELDIASAHALESAVVELCVAGAREIVLDMQELEFIDSTGFRAILTSRERCEECGAQLVMTRPRERVNRMLHVSGMLRRLPFR